MLKNTAILSVFLIIFSINEKVRKEMFIINLTNSKTKKQLMKIFNHTIPSVIITKDGLI